MSKAGKASNTLGAKFKTPSSAATKMSVLLGHRKARRWIPVIPFKDNVYLFQSIHISVNKNYLQSWSYSANMCLDSRSTIMVPNWGTNNSIWAIFSAPQIMIDPTLLKQDWTSCERRYKCPRKEISFVLSVTLVSNEKGECLYRRHIFLLPCRTAT